MEKDSRDEALKELLQLHSIKGYITLDDIMDIAENYSLSFQDTDWLSESVVLRNTIIYDTEAQASNRIDSADDEYDDYSKSDYEEVYKQIVGLNSSLEPYIERLRIIKPPQRGEFDSLKYQLVDGDWYVKERAKERIVEMYLRTALKMALQKAETYDLDLEETIGYANEGLVKAVDRYDPDTHGSFQPYASMWIMQNMDRNQDTRSPLIHYSKTITDAYFAVYPLLKMKDFPADASGLPEELHNKLQVEYGLNDHQVKGVLLAGTEITSLDMLIDEGRLVEVPAEGNTNPLFEEYYWLLFDDKVFKMLCTLTYRESEVVTLYFGLFGGRKRTLEEVGNKLNLTRERIRQILKKALGKLRHPSRAFMVRDYYRDGT